MTANLRLLMLLGVLSFMTRPVVAEPTTEPVSFADQIRPLLSDKCFACHGPDEQERAADWRLDLIETAIDAGVIVPGQPDESELIRRILSDDADERMPPAESLKALSPAEIDLLRRWVSEGAVHQQHWSYRPLVRPPLPAIDHPQLRNPIDAFVLRRLVEHSRSLAPQAEPHALVRRLHFDLLGMPPDYEEVQRFIEDQSEHAWEQLVDRLLRDPRFGERMAIFWLDLVRYADTIGYHSDVHMEVSAYRDYVIAAFNENLPFDQFTIEQLAGDLLPDPTPRQRIASGYNRLLQTTEEGGAQPKEYIAIYAADRVRNVSAVWMGQTVGCAQCHDHKYDPITTKDFYALAAFFADLKEVAVGRRNPNFKVVDAEQQRRIDELTAVIAERQIEHVLSVNRDLAERLKRGQQTWESETLAAIGAADDKWRQPADPRVSATDGVELRQQADGSFLSTGANPDVGTYTYEAEITGRLTAIRLDALPDASFSRAQGFSRGNGNFVLSKVSVFVDDQPVPIAGAVASYEQESHPLSDALDDQDQTGWAVDGFKRTADRCTALFHLQTPLEFAQQPGKLRIELRHHSPHKQHLIGRFLVSLSGHDAVELPTETALPPEVLTALRRPVDSRSAEQRGQLANYYQTIAPELVDVKKQLDAATQQLDQYRNSLRTMLVSEASPEPRVTRILPRGNWLDDSGEIVQPAVPEFLPHDPVAGRRANRLDLANWLVADDHPLTARTFVNRLWRLFYGHGLSRNLDDLGGQGQPPTHPELLDWLAVEFRDSGWDVKALVRLMVTSGTYLQTSFAGDEARAADPANRDFARQTAWRLDAEFVRDTALSLSGLLVCEPLGGPSVKPYQPAGYWQHLNFPTRQWKPDQGENLYRRGLYTYWCRTFPHPAMLAFDAPSREECTAQRARSNIPQQALVLLNDPTFVEASRVFAQRIIAASTDTDQRISWAIRQAMSRDPAPAEVELLRELLADQLRRFRQSPAAAQELVALGAAPPPSDIDPVELAAWSQVGRAILNAYETTSRY